MVTMELLDIGRESNLPSLIIQHMERFVDTTKPKHAMPYGFTLTELFDMLNISLPKLNFGNHNDVLDVVMLKQCGYAKIKGRGPTGSAIFPGSYRAVELSNKLELDLEENAKLREENDELQN